jgi:hypothetical protein
MLVWHGHEKIGDTNTEFHHSLFGGCPPVGGGFSLPVRQRTRGRTRPGHRLLLQSDQLWPLLFARNVVPMVSCRAAAAIPT